MEDSDFSDGNNDDEKQQEKSTLDPDNPENAFAILEREFTKTIAEIEQDVHTSQYAEEFSKMFEKLYQMNEDKKTLNVTIDELQSKLSATSNKLEISERLTKTDAETIEELKDQINHAWKMADMAHLREQIAQEVIDNLRKQIKETSAELEMMKRIAQEEAEEDGQSKMKEALLREKAKLTKEVQQLTEKVSEGQKYQESLERRNSAAELKINEISGKLEDETAECERQKSNKTKLEAEVTDLKEMLDSRDKQITELKTNLAMVQRTVTKIETQLSQQKVAYDKLYRESECVVHRQQKYMEELKQAYASYEILKEQLYKKIGDIKSGEEEIARLKMEHIKIGKGQDAAEKRTKHVEGERDLAVLEISKLRQLISNMEKQIFEMKKVDVDDKRQIENLSREKEIMNKNILRQQGVAQDHIKLIRIQEQSRRKLESEIDEYKVVNNKYVKQVTGLERERDRLAEEAIDLSNKIEIMMDDIRFKKDEIYELKKSLAELENKMRMQENLFEVVRADRNSLQKSLQETTAEIGELKGRLKLVCHQTEQLKEDIATKEQLLVKEENILRKVTKEKENLVIDLNNANDSIKNLKFEISELSAEEKRLHKCILEGERTIRQQAKDLEQLMNERDILGSQLVRRNDELALLYEKIRILQTTLQRGEAQYDQRLEDIRLLKIEIKRLRQEKQLLTRSVTNATDLRQEIFHLDRDLTRERLKCRALEDELQTPLNVHRWRQLQGSDPKALELLQKIQLLQKRLLQQTEEGVEREKQMKELERLYLNLKSVVSRQPGAEIQEELLKTQRALVSRKNKMKCLVSELNMTEQKADEYKFQMEKLVEELNQMKKKALSDKKALAKRVGALQATAIEKEMSSVNSQTKFTGGGFKMTV